MWPNLSAHTKRRYKPKLELRLQLFWLIMVFTFSFVGSSVQLVLLSHVLLIASIGQVKLDQVCCKLQDELEFERTKPQPFCYVWLFCAHKSQLALVGFDVRANDSYENHAHFCIQCDVNTRSLTHIKLTWTHSYSYSHSSPFINIQWTSSAKQRDKTLPLSQQQQQLVPPNQATSQRAARQDMVWCIVVVGVALWRWHIWPDGKRHPAAKSCKIDRQQLAFIRRNAKKLALCTWHVNSAKHQSKLSTIKFYVWSKLNCDSLANLSTATSHNWFALFSRLTKLTAS